MSMIAVGIGALGSIGMGIWKRSAAKKKEQRAKKKEKKARQEMNRLKGIYASLDNSNPYLTIENKMVDLTINQQQAQFQSQQFQQSQANILGGLRGAAGGAGIAGLAQQLAQQGQIASQQASAGIGQQERQNQMAERQAAAQIQAKEREGVVKSREAELAKQSTLLGMSQAETAAHRQDRLAAQQAKQDATMGMVSGALQAFGGASDRELKKNIELIGKSPSGLKIYTFEYIDDKYGEGIFQGVMSDEIPQDAVMKNKDGYDMVDYSKLDVEFKNIN